MKALIVGGGIAGISTGLALSRIGIDVDLIERNAEISTLGSGITLVASAMRALDGLGALEECMAEGYGLTEMTICNVAGQPLMVMPLPSAAGTDLPGMMGMTRPGLHRILLDRAASAGLTVRTGLSPDQIQDGKDSARVSFSDGSAADYDLVIGADGLRSQIREQVCGPTSPTFTGQLCYRIVVPRPSSVTSEVVLTGCPTAHVGFTPTGESTMYIWCLVEGEDSTRPLQGDLPAIVRSHLAPFGGVVAGLREQITDPAQVNVARLETIVAPQPWFRGRTVLVGDAAHSTTPHLAAGAAMCLEDGLALAEELQAHANVTDALLAYSQRRYERCRYVVETSAQLGAWQLRPETPGADQEALRGAAFHVLAGAY